MRNILGSNNFETAVQDYFLLLNKSYPEQRSRLLVSDRYHLNKYQRTVLFRGVFSDPVNKARRSRLTAIRRPDDDTLFVDLLNVLLLLMNYQYGRSVFRSTDLLLRDVGEHFFKFDSRDYCLLALGALKESLGILGFPRVLLVADTEKSRQYPKILQNPKKLIELLKPPGVSLEWEYSASTDKLLSQLSEGILATSDSAVIDKSRLPLIDLPGHALNTFFQARPLDLYRLIYPD